MKKFLKGILSWIGLILSALAEKDKKKEIEKKKPCIPPEGCDVKKMKKFLDVMIPFADLKNFNRWAIFTHAWHETAGFTRAIGNNYFGIKKPRHWEGKVVIKTTHEYVKAEGGEKRIKINLPFADWDTLADALIWYGGLIERLYHIAYKNRYNPDGYFVGLVAGKYEYATDPKYVSKLRALYYKLQGNDFVKNLVKKEK